MLILVFLSFLFFSALADWYALQVPVADLRALPQDADPLNYGYCDPLQLTQVLFGECLSFINESDGWIAVAVPTQYTDIQPENVLIPSVGFLRSNQTILVSGNYKCTALEYMTLTANKLRIPIYRRACVPGCLADDILLYTSLGTRFQPANVCGRTSNWISITLPNGSIGWVSASDVNTVSIAWQINKGLVKDIIKTAYDLLGMVYFHGGRSAYDPSVRNQLTGIDNAGLIGLSHQTHGVVLPIDAGGMFAKSSSGPHIPLLEGSLLFLNSSLGLINYVSLYIGDGLLIESTNLSEVNSSRLISVESRFGVNVTDLKYGMTVGDETLLWGDYLS